MKKLLIFFLPVLLMVQAQGQDLPKDVEQVYKGAEKLKNRKDYDQAIAAYKEVLRSVEHIPSLVSIADIQMELRSQPNYREAYEYYDRAIKEIDKEINATDKRKVKAELAEYREKLVPRRNKAKSYVDDFDKAKERRQDGNRLMEDPDLKDD